MLSSLHTRRMVCIEAVKTEYSRTISPAFIIGRGVKKNFYIEIKLCDGALRIVGKGYGCGQIVERLLDDRLIPAKGFEYPDLLKIHDIWNRWHFNDMRAGTPKQEDFIREWRLSNEYTYQKACEALEEIGLLYDDGYKYGSSWLKEDLPIDIIRYLFSLPGSGDSWLDMEFASINQEEFLDII